MNTNTRKLLRGFVLLNSIFILMNACKHKPAEVNDAEITTIVRKVSVANPGRTALKITNTTNSTLTFSLELNGSPKFEIAQIADYVSSMPSEYDDEPLERKAWRFVRDNLKFNTAYSEKKWQHNPHLLLNSLGFGQCDDHCTLLVQLWKELGFEARVWSLTGHVVSEVKSNNKWQMFDAAYGVYYYNQEKQVASVQELSSQNSLIERPIEITPFRKSNDLYTQFARYNSSTANKYATQQDNSVSTWFAEDDTGIDNQIQLPAAGSITFPLNKENYQFEVLHNSASLKEAFVSYISVTIPKNQTGVVKLPFVLAGVKGEGVVELNDERYEVSDVEANVLKPGFISEIKVIENKGGINLAYYINPNLFKLQHSNALIIRLEEPKSISIDTVSSVNTQKDQAHFYNDSTTNSRKENTFIRPFINDSVALINYYHFVNNKSSWQQLLKEVETTEQLIDVIRVYYETQENKTFEEQKVRVKRVIDLIRQLNKVNAENENLIIEISKRSDLMYFINIVESNEAKDVVLIVEALKSQINSK